MELSNLLTAMVQSTETDALAQEFRHGQGSLQTALGGESRTAKEL